MIDVVATRRMTFEGESCTKGDPLKMPAQQFTDLEPTGMVERAPAEKKAPVKPVETKSSDTAD